MKWLWKRINQINLIRDDKDNLLLALCIPVKTGAEGRRLTHAVLTRLISIENCSVNLSHVKKLK
jgi:hypothetical protein